MSRRSYTKEKRDWMYNRAKELMNRDGLSQRVVAERLNVSCRTIQILFLEKEGDMKLYTKVIHLTEKECEFIKSLLTPIYDIGIYCSFSSPSAIAARDIIKKIDKSKPIPVKSHKEAK